MCDQYSHQVDIAHVQPLRRIFRISHLASGTASSQLSTSMPTFEVRAVVCAAILPAALSQRFARFRMRGHARFLSICCFKVLHKVYCTFLSANKCPQIYWHNNLHLPFSQIHFTHAHESLACITSFKIIVPAGSVPNTLQTSSFMTSYHMSRSSLIKSNMFDPQHHTISIDC